MASLLANSHTATGGISSVSVPLQGAPYVNAQWGDYSASFNSPPSLQGTYLAEFDLKLLIVPIPFYGMEGALQMDHAIVPLIDARMHDSTMAAIDTFSQSLFNNYTNNQQIIGLPGAADDGTNLVTYGNQNRTNNTWWQSKVYNAGAVAPTRKLIFQYIAGVNRWGAEIPTFGLCGFGTFASLANDYIGNESYQIQPGRGFDTDADRPRSGFRALDVAGVPVYADPYCPEGIVYLLNSNYLNLYVHEAASFNFTGFESMLPSFQIGSIGAVLTLCELVCTKPRTQGRVFNFTFLTL
jgi:hypothetical protein